jgi:hypothetical protein
MYQKLFKQVLKYKDYLVSNTLKDNAILNKHISSLTEYIKQFASKPPDNINDFIQDHQVELLLIHDILIGTYFKLYAPKNLAPELRGLHDRLFNILSIKRPKQKFSRIATIVCTEFCKGITFFANNTGIDRIPFYHRDASCGKANETSRDKFAKHLNENEKHFLENCYIERLIYDKMYSHEADDISLQNKEHIHYLDVIKKEYQQCFKGYEVDVNITWSKDTIPSIPEALTITTLKNGQVVSTETYKKTIQIGTFGEKSYEELVQCTREAAEKRFQKYQSFLGGDQRWKVVINR